MGKGFGGTLGAVESSRYLGIARPSCGDRVIPGILLQLRPSVTHARTSTVLFFPPCCRLRLHFFTGNRDSARGDPTRTESARIIAKGTP